MLILFALVAAALALPAPVTSTVAFEGHALNPVFSADGRFVAFETNDYGGRLEVWGWRHGSGDPEKVPVPGQTAFAKGTMALGPAWHRDGVMAFEAGSGEYRIRVFQPGFPQSEELMTVAEQPGAQTFPMFSADGARLVFVSGETGQGDLRVRSMDKGTLTPLRSTEGTETFPQFSADGSTLLYGRKMGDMGDLFTMDPLRMAETSLVQAPDDQTRPTWAAGGAQVAYFSRTESGWSIAAVDAAGGSPRTVVQAVDLPLRARPALSPDQQWVAWAHPEPPQQNRIRLTRLDGQKTVEVPSPYTACSEPALAQRGDEIWLAYSALPSAEAAWRFLVLQDVTELLR
ncbi:MAG: Tol biopolymer transport system component [Myxococcota bacterium]|jgi:Tol biopolymer transport system component